MPKKNYVRFFFFFSLFLLNSQTLQAATFNVSSAADLQTALTTAAGNGENDIINVAAGTYNTSDNGGQVFEYLSSEGFGISLVGENSATTILDGGGVDQVLSIVSTSVEIMTISVSGLTLQNGLAPSAVSGGGVFISLAFTGGSTVNLSDLIIQNNSTTDSSGGGAYVSIIGDVNLSHLTITGNNALGGGFSGAGASFITAIGDVIGSNITASQNSGDSLAYGGGGCYFESAIGNVTLSDSTFSQNSIGTAGDGGGFYIYSLDGDTSLTSVTANSNSIDDTMGVGGLVFASGNITVSDYTANQNQGLGGETGGGAYFESTNGGAVSVTNASVSNNQSGVGAGLYLRSLIGSGSVTVSGSTFLNNTSSSSSGAVHVTSVSSYTFQENTVQGNTAILHAGGVFLDGPGTVVRNYFSGNNSADDGGAFFLQLEGSEVGNFLNNIVVSNVATDQGGGIYSNVPAATTWNVVNNTIYSNSSDVGGGISLAATTSTVNIYNNIIYGNTAATPTSGDDIYAVFSLSPTMNLFNNDFTEVCFLGSGCDPVAELGSNQGNNVDVDPLFTNSSGNDFTLTSASTLIDEGVNTAPALPTTDYAGNARDFGLAPDMGAYEAIPSSSSSATSISFNEDGSQTITISNNGNYPLNVTALTLSDSTYFSLDTSGGESPCGELPFSIAGGDSCTLLIEFIADVGSTSSETVTSTLTITTDDPANSTITVTLTGITSAGGGGDNGGGNNGGGSNSDMQGSGGCTLSLGNTNSYAFEYLIIFLSAIFYLRKNKNIAPITSAVRNTPKKNKIVD